MNTNSKTVPTNLPPVLATEAQALRERFVDAMSSNATPVTVVTTDGAAGRYGMTVSAFSSVSADPPTVLVCANRSTPAREAIVDNGVFAVNVLREDQHELSEVFSGRAAPRFDFSAHPWSTGDLGAPVSPAAVATFECRVESTHESGSHTVIIGRVLAIHRGAGQPLIYCQRRYTKLTLDPCGY